MVESHRYLATLNTLPPHICVEWKRALSPATYNQVPVMILKLVLHTKNSLLVVDPLKTIYVSFKLK